MGLYAKHFTHADVLTLLEFYSTPVGRKAIAIMPTLLQEGAAVGQQWGEANMERISNVILERVTREGLLK